LKNYKRCIIRGERTWLQAGASERGLSLGDDTGSHTHEDGKAIPGADVNFPTTQPKH